MDDAGDAWQLWGSLALVVLIVLGAILWFVLAHWRPWDPRLGAERTALALQAREGDSIRFRCEREENDGSIDGISDVDYVCEPIGHPEENGYWVGTDAHRITALQSMG